MSWGAVDDDNAMHAAARAMRPIVVLDPSEPALPCTVEHYLRQARVVTIGDGIPQTDWGEARATDIRPFDNRHSLEYKANDLYVPDDVNDVPMYCNIKRLDGGGHRLQYWMLYPFNPFCGALGSHASDWEFCSIYTNARGTPTKVYVSAHGEQEGQWYAWADVAPDGRPRLFACRGSHAMHADVGRQACCAFGGCFCFPRLCCTANDCLRVSRSSPVWDSHSVEFVNSDTPWVKYQGDWGYNRKEKKGHVSSLGRRSNWNGPESTFSSTSWFNPCFMVPLRKLFPMCFTSDHACRGGCCADARPRTEL